MSILAPAGGPARVATKATHGDQPGQVQQQGEASARSVPGCICGTVQHSGAVRRTEWKCPSDGAAYSDHEHESCACPHPYHHRNSTQRKHSAVCPDTMPHATPLAGTTVKVSLPPQSAPNMSRSFSSCSHRHESGTASCATTSSSGGSVYGPYGPYATGLSPARRRPPPLPAAAAAGSSAAEVLRFRAAAGTCAGTGMARDWGEGHLCALPTHTLRVCAHQPPCLPS